MSLSPSEPFPNGTYQGQIRALALLALATPLVVGHGVLLYPYVTPKVLFFRSIVLLLLAVWIPAWLRGQVRLRRSLVGAAVLIALASFLVSSLAGIDVRRSLFDTPARMLSLFTVLCFAAYYAVLASSMRSWPDWRPLLRALAVVSLLVFLGAIGQRVGLVPDDGGFGNRPSSTTGNPVFLAGFASCVFFLVLPLAAREHSRPWRWLAIAAAGLAVVTIVLSETRGTFLALLAGATVTLVGYRVAFRDRPRLRRALSIVLVASALLAAALWTGRDSDLVQRIPLVRRITSASLEKGSPRMRVGAWGVALAAGRERPWLGYGPGNFYHAYNHFYRPDMVLAGRGVSYADHAHNVPANTFAVQGVPGLLAYLLLVAAPLLVLIRKFERGRIDGHVAAAGLGFIAAHFVHGLFAFEEIASYLCLFLFLALVDGLDEAEPEEASPAPDPPRRWIGAGCAAMAIAGIVVGNLLPGLASAKTHRASAAVLRVEAGAVRRVEGVGRPFVPHARYLRVHLAKMIADGVPRWVAAKRREEAQMLLTEAWEGVREAQIAYPLDVQLAVVAAAVSSQQALLSSESNHLRLAGEKLEEALRFAPGRQDLKFALARTLLLLGQPQEALDWAVNAYQGEPDAPDSVWQVAKILVGVGQADDARRLVAQALGRGVVLRGESARFALELLGE